MGSCGTRAIIKWWDPSQPNEIKYCTSAKFNEHETYLPNGKLSPESQYLNNTSTIELPTLTIDSSKHPLHFLTNNLLKLSSQYLK